MDKFIVMGGKALKGEIELQAAKNAVLPILSCCILCKDDIVLKNCPQIADVKKMMDIIVRMGGTAQFTGNDIHINCKNADAKTIDAELTKSIRSSVFMLGPLLGRFKKAEVSYPGGCEIGKRPIDIHIDGLRELGVKIAETETYIQCDGAGMKCASLHLSFPSVGATENLMMAAVFIKGKTRIRNAAREPEIVDLQNFINAMGGNIHGAGTETIEVEGVDALHGCMFSPVSDRIAAGSYLAMCAACGGDIVLKNCDTAGVALVLQKLQACGCKSEICNNSIRLIAAGKMRALPLLRTEPFPGFPTDMQPQFCAMLCTAEGTSVIEENVFENRFKYTEQLRAIGANITVEGHRATVHGVKELLAGKLYAEDLRGGAALVTAALAVDGISVIYGVKHIDRGYFHMEEALTALGADIVRIHGGD